MRQRLPVLLVLLLGLIPALLFGCTSQKEASAWSIYYPTSGLFDGAALGSEPYTGTEPPTVEQLMERLLSEPEDSALRSPFPRGVSLRSSYEREGVLYINLSEPYGGLSGIELTLADYAITLTLCQLPGVEGVSITVENDPIPFRYRQILTTGDVLLTDQLGEEAP